MRVLLALVGLVAIVVVIGLSLGLIHITQTREGKLPTLAVSEGEAPAFQANVATVSVGSENKTVRVPTVTMKDQEVRVPTVKLNKPDNAAEPAAN